MLLLRGLKSDVWLQFYVVSIVKTIHSRLAATARGFSHAATRASQHLFPQVIAEVTVGASSHALMMPMCNCRATARTPNATPEEVHLSQADLLHGAKLQLRGALRMKVSAAAVAAAGCKQSVGCHVLCRLDGCVDALYQQ